MVHKPTKDDLELIVGFTPAQRAFLAMLTDQRIANIVSASDLLGDFDAEALYLLRLLGSEDGRHLRKFFLEARPETLEFLVNLRKKEVEEIDKAIATALTLRRITTFIWWAVGGIVAGLISMLVLAREWHSWWK